MIVIGIDIAKETFDVAFGVKGGVEQFANIPEGHDELIKKLSTSSVELIILEATGGYEFAVASALQAAGFPVAIINPRQARDFAKAMGYLAKTDRIDSRVLAQMAEVLARHPDRDKIVKPLPSEELQRIQAIVTRRRQANHIWRTSHRQVRPLHGDTGRGTLQPCYARLLRATCEYC